MKTAYEMLLEVDQVLGINDSKTLFELDEVIKAMKLYANSKLDEAANNSGVKMTRDIPAGQRYMWNHRTDCHYSVNKETILSLKDKV